MCKVISTVVLVELSCTMGGHKTHLYNKRQKVATGDVLIHLFFYSVELLLLFKPQLLFHH